MSCQPKCDSLHFVSHSLINSPPLSPLFPAFLLLGFGQSSVPSLTLYLSLGSHFPPFVPVSFVSLCLLICPPTPARLSLAFNLVLSFGVQGHFSSGWSSGRVVNASFHRCRFDKRRFGRIKDTGSPSFHFTCSPEASPF